MLFACKQDIKTISRYYEIDTLPEMVAKDIRYIRSDSGKVTAELTSEIMYQYSDDEPYFEFPEGFEVIFYDSVMNIKSTLTANYGIGFEKKKLMKARDDVVIVNLQKNETLNTEQLIWDQRKKKIYSDVKVKITTQNDILYGDGLRSDESFNEYDIVNPTGVFRVKDEK